MKVNYDPEADALTITFREATVENSDEIAEGWIADYDADGNIVALEILDASEIITRPDRVEFTVEEAETVAA